MQDSIPFAVVGTDKEHQVNGHKVLGRKTKWGIIEGELCSEHSAEIVSPKGIPEFWGKNINLFNKSYISFYRNMIFPELMYS